MMLSTLLSDNWQVLFSVVSLCLFICLKTFTAITMKYSEWLENYAYSVWYELVQNVCHRARFAVSVTSCFTVVVIQ